jgi:hypothetical protein
MRPADRDPPELIPYASHVAHGTGRTPIGIILFAASHLLLGGVIVAAAAMLLRVIPQSEWTRKPENLIWPALAAALAVSMLTGGVTLLLKGRTAWATCVVSFTSLAIAEAFAGVLGTIMLVRGAKESSQWGMMQAGIATLLLAMSSVVLGYLGSEKARRTFGLPPGETSRAVRWLPRVVLVLFIVGVVLATL